jgi:hypothetical protein
MYTGVNNVKSRRLMIHEVKSQFKPKGDGVKKGQEVNDSGNLNLTNRQIYLIAQHESTKRTFFKLILFSVFPIFYLKN